MKKLFLMTCFLILCASVAFGQSWNPTPMVVNTPDAIHYAFDGTLLEVPFDLAGKPGTFYLVIDTKLDDAQKPVAIMNGFKGWHFVNGIDTTVFVSSGREYTTGLNLKFPWDGKGNEKNYENLVSSGNVMAGTYKYTLIGFDSSSGREIANDVIHIGNYSMPTLSRFYWKDDQTGAQLANPMIIGGQRYNRSNTVLAKTNTQFKFRLGDDPFDQSKITTCSVFGFQKSDIVPNQTIQRGAPMYDQNDYNTFYMPAAKGWELVATVQKYTFVPGGEAVQDLSWGDWSKLAFYCNPPYGNAGIVLTDSSNPDNLYYEVPNITPVQYPVDSINGFLKSDPTESLFEVLLLESYIPNVAADAAGVQRLTGEIGRFDPGPLPGQGYLAGDSSCLLDLVDMHKMIEGGDEPYATDGSGYIVWANSNGDFFCDKNAYVEPVNPAQVWACNTFEPRTNNNMRPCPCQTDMSGIMNSFLDFGGLFSCAWYTQDGTGINLIKFADDAFAAGGENTQKKGNGQTLDCGSQFDGIYMLKPIMAEPAAMNQAYDGTCWVAWDSDFGIITNQAVAVEEDAPAAFTVAQNTPNPFNPTTTINFTLAGEGQVSVDVFNVAGQKVDTLVNEFMSAGSHAVSWDASGFAAGVYFYTVTSGDYSRTMKMTLLK